jgi:DNA-binding NarL/FixJ family response regulator
MIFGKGSDPSTSRACRLWGEDGLLPLLFFMIPVGEAPDLQDALKDVQTLKPDVVLMNDYLPPTNSALATKLFRELDVTAAILIISIDVEPEMIQQSLANGANGFMHKDEMGTLLTEAIRKVYNNEQYLSQRTEYALANEND